MSEQVGNLWYHVYRVEIEENTSDAVFQSNDHTRT